MTVLQFEKAQSVDLLAHCERRIYAAIARFMSNIRAPSTQRDIRVLLDQGNITGAQKIVEDHIVAMGGAIPQAFVSCATQEMERQLPAGRRARVAKAVPHKRVTAGFDPSDARAAQTMRTARLRFVQQFTDSQRDATRYALASAFQEGDSPRQAARAFRDAIGLTRTQLQYVESYRRTLESNSSEALKRELRDRRFDTSVERAVEEGTPLTEDQIDRMVERYQEKFVAYRAENIARTEALKVVSAARQEATQQLVDQLGIDPARIRRTWVAVKDKRTRDAHAEMDGQTVGLDEPFIAPDGTPLMYPGDESAPANLVINCRCTVTTEILDQDELDAA